MDAYKRTQYTAVRGGGHACQLKIKQERIQGGGQQGNRPPPMGRSQNLGFVPSCKGFVPILRVFSSILRGFVSNLKGFVPTHAYFIPIFNFFVAKFRNIFVPKILVPPLAEILNAPLNLNGWVARVEGGRSNQICVRQIYTGSQGIHVHRIDPIVPMATQIILRNYKEKQVFSER